MAAHHGPRVLPDTLNSPELIAVWRMRSLIVGVAFTILSALVVCHGRTGGRTHLLRAYLMGYMTCFGFAGGGLVLLMLQYVSGGKWGLLLRRPLEAMAGTMPLVALMVIPIGLGHEEPVPVGALRYATKNLASCKRPSDVVLSRR